MFVHLKLKKLLQRQLKTFYIKHSRRSSLALLFMLIVLTLLLLFAVKSSSAHKILLRWMYEPISSHI